MADRPTPTASSRFRTTLWIARWLGLATTLLLAAAWLGSGWVSAHYVIGANMRGEQMRMSVGSGLFFIDFGGEAEPGDADYAGRPFHWPPGLRWYSNWGRPFWFHFSFDASSGASLFRDDSSRGFYRPMTSVRAPIWFPLLLVAAPTAFYWYRHTRQCFKIPPHLCRHCRYDRSGLEPDALCPECGKRC